MKLTYRTHRDLVITVENPDERITSHINDRMRAAIEAEIIEFLQEAQVLLRNLPSGQSMTIHSKPISVTVSKPEMNGDQ